MSKYMLLAKHQVADEDGELKNREWVIQERFDDLRSAYMAEAISNSHPLTVDTMIVREVIAEVIEIPDYPGEGVDCEDS